MPSLKTSSKSKRLSCEYSDLSLQITNELSTDVKKAHGIFITPKTLIQILIDRVLEITDSCKIPIQFVVEPSCGTCEFINYLDEKIQNATIHGIELNNTIYSQLDASKFTRNSVELFNQDFLEFIPPAGGLYNLCVGNPPYVVIKKEDVPIPYVEYSICRPNLFVLFIIHSLTMLTQNGILAFIIPSSFLNSAYYSKVRSHIKLTCHILDIIDFKDTNIFIDTSQNTFGLIIQKKVAQSSTAEDEALDACKFSYKIFGGDYVFTNDSLQLHEIFKDSTTLQKMGCFVKTGNIVWNQHKNHLTESNEDTILLYNSNLTPDHTIELKNFHEISQNKKSKKTDSVEEKAQYINLNTLNSEKKKGSIMIERKKGCAIIVNRGNGNSAYKLNYALIPDDFPFYIVENHLNVIDTLLDDKMEIFAKIIRSFNDPRTSKFIDMFLGNNGLSKTELETIFPIYL